MKTGFDVPKPKMRTVSKWDNNENVHREGSTKRLPHFDMFVEVKDEKYIFDEKQQYANYLGIVYNKDNFRLKTPATIYIGYEQPDLKLAEAVRENILATCPSASVIHIETGNILMWAKGKNAWNAVFQIKSPHRKEELKDRLHEVINWKDWEESISS